MNLSFLTSSRRTDDEGGGAESPPRCEVVVASPYLRSSRRFSFRTGSRTGKAARESGQPSKPSWTKSYRKRTTGLCFRKMQQCLRDDAQLRQSGHEVGGSSLNPDLQRDETSTDEVSPWTQLLRSAERRSGLRPAKRVISSVPTTFSGWTRIHFSLAVLAATRSELAIHWVRN